MVFNTLAGFPAIFFTHRLWDGYEDERDYLNDVGHKGKSSARKVKRALALLKADEGISDPKISEALSISVPTVGRLRKRFVVEGMERSFA